MAEGSMKGDGKVEKKERPLFFFPSPLALPLAKF